MDHGLWTWPWPTGDPQAPHPLDSISHLQNFQGLKHFTARVLSLVSAAQGAQKSRGRRGRAGALGELAVSESPALPSIRLCL